jgi:hypothetical protein
VDDVTFYDSWEQAMDAERKAREVADTKVTPWHLKCRAGDILVSDPGYGFPIFHEILDNELIVKENLQKYGDDYEDEGVYILDMYCFSPEPWHYRFARNYSEAVPEGELGDFHLSVAIGKLKHHEDFEKLKANNFYIDAPIEVTK